MTLLHAAVRRLRPGRRPLHLRIASMPAERVRFILRLVEAGHGRQVLMAGDMACRRCLRAAGLDDADAQALVVANPASLLTWRVG